MVIDECFQLGYIIKPHGLKGELLILLDVDFPDEYRKLESVLVSINNQLVPFFIDNLNITGEKAIIKLRGVDDIDKAEEFRKRELYLPLDLLPDLGDSQFYFHEVIGYTVVDKDLGQLGTVKDIFSNTGQDLIVMHYKQKEVLIPLQDDILLSVDKINQVLNVRIPEGLLDIYL